MKKTLEELIAMRDELRLTLGVRNAEELAEKFDFWEFRDDVEVELGFQLDRLEFLTS